MSNSIFSLDGKIALITGAGQGIGFTLAKGLGEAGATVILNGRHQEQLDEAARQLRQQGIQAYTSVFDVSHKEEVAREVVRLEAEVGPIDILVNNAGIQRRAPLEAFPEETWRELIDINLTGVFLTTQQVVQGMLRRGHGKIINICSLQSELGRQTIVPYTASKGGVKMMTRGMAVEWGKHNIQVNGIGPGYFKTALNTKLIEDEKFNAWVCARTPAGRWGELDELVGAAVFLASPASDFVTGQIIYVDGGILASV